MSWENRWYVDLAMVVLFTGLTLFVIVTGLNGWLRAGLTALLVTLLPGYALIAFLFPGEGSEATRTFDDNDRGLRNPLPGKSGIDPVERFVFSVATSIVVVPVVALLANFSPFGITLVPILFGLAGLTVFLALGAFVRRALLSPEQRYVPNPSTFGSRIRYSSPKAGFSVGNPWTRRFNVLLFASILVFAASVGFAAANPPQSEGFTEFYVETDDVTGDTESMYPSQFSTGESRTVPVTVTNQEHEPRDYTVVVLLQQVDGSGDGATVQEERQLEQTSVSLDDGESQTVDLSVQPDMQGENLRLVLLLYDGQPPGDPSTESAYRVLRLPIDVGGGSSTSTEAVTAQSMALVGADVASVHAVTG